jgi:type I restriction enzyme M protein
VPKREVALYAEQFSRFGLDSSVVLVEKDGDYCDFRPEIEDKRAIRQLIENHPNVQVRRTEMEKHLEGWWLEAAEAITQFPGENNLAHFRKHYQHSLLEALLPIGVLDEFQTAGIFVNWWEAVRYDFKTIVAAGWSINLIPVKYVLDMFFKTEQAEIEVLENRATELEAELSEALESVDLEKIDDKEEDEKSPTVAETIQALKSQISELNAVYLNQVDHENLKTLNGTFQRIESIEKNLKAAKKVANNSRAGLENLAIAYRKTLKLEEAQRLILKKLFDLISNELNRYSNNQVRFVIRVFENLWDKYTLSLHSISTNRSQTDAKLKEYLSQMGYEKFF